MKSPNKMPVKKSNTLVKDRVQMPPNYNAKAETGMESAMCKSPIGWRGR